MFNNIGGCEMNKLTGVYTALKNNISKIIIGKGEVIDLVLITLFCGGHILIDDVPGTGKTRLAKTLADSIDCTCKRVQFTPDLLPADLTGVNYFNMQESRFEFLPGPVFSNILLADEINRATPKTQAGLLECMEERQVTVDGKTYRLEYPFMVIATQNPVDSMGTFPLPEAQLDRFLIKTKMGYPSRDESNEIIRSNAGAVKSVRAVVSKNDIQSVSEAIDGVYAHADIINYISTIIEATRLHSEVILGASPRAGIHLLRVAKGRALIKGRDYVLPDDVKAVAVSVLAHRLILNNTSRVKSGQAEVIINDVLTAVPVPTEEAFDR
jgi:MoxR-like ATPase